VLELLAAEMVFISMELARAVSDFVRTRCMLFCLWLLARGFVLCALCLLELPAAEMMFMFWSWARQGLHRPLGSGARPLHSSAVILS
jgi:uncharacterized protein (DUF2236 family)